MKGLYSSLGDVVKPSKMLSGDNDRDSDRTGISTTTVASYTDCGLISSLMTLANETLLEANNNSSSLHILLNNTASLWKDIEDGNGTGSGVNSTEVPYTPYEYRPETYIIPIVFAIIFIVGVLGNGTLVIVFLRHRTMRNVPNT